MTRDELAQRVNDCRVAAKVYEDGATTSVHAIVQLADERDAAINQRDRALALLRECDLSSTYPEWEHRRRALLAEVDAP